MKLVHLQLLSNDNWRERSISTAARILLIKNEVGDTSSIKNTLEYLGYRVDELLFSKEDVIEKTRDFHPDIVLMDRSEGEEGECKVVQWMRNEVDVPVVQLISSVEKNSVDLMNVDDLSDYVLKPVNEMDLFYSIEIAWYKHELNKKIGKNQENFLKLSDTIDELVFSINSEYKITNWNSSIEQMSGYAFNDVMGRDVERLGIFGQVDEIKRIVDDVCNNNSVNVKTFHLGVSTKNSEKNMIAVQSLNEMYVDNDISVSVVFIGRAVSSYTFQQASVEESNGCFLDGCLVELLRFLCEKKGQVYGIMFRDIKKGLNVSYPTIRKRIGLLERLALVHVVKNGNRKVVYVTAKGKNVSDDIII